MSIAKNFPGKPDFPNWPDKRTLPQQQWRRPTTDQKGSQRSTRLAQHWPISHVDPPGLSFVCTPSGPDGPGRGCSGLPALLRIYRSINARLFLLVRACCEWCDL